MSVSQQSLDSKMADAFLYTCTRQAEQRKVSLMSRTDAEAALRHDQWGKKLFMSSQPTVVHYVTDISEISWP